MWFIMERREPTKRWEGARRAFDAKYDKKPIYIYTTSSVEYSNERDFIEKLKEYAIFRGDEISDIVDGLSGKVRLSSTGAGGSMYNFEARFSRNFGSVKYGCHFTDEFPVDHDERGSFDEKKYCEERMDFIINEFLKSCESEEFRRLRERANMLEGDEVYLRAAKRKRDNH